MAGLGRVGKSLRNLAVGPKLIGTLVLVVLLTALIFSVIQDNLAWRYMEEFGRKSLRDHLNQMAMVWEALPPDKRRNFPVLSATLRRHLSQHQLNLPISTFLLNKEGQVQNLRLFRWHPSLDADTAARIIQMGRGDLSLERDDGDLLVCFIQLPDRHCFLATQGKLEDILGITRQALAYTSLLLALGLACLTAFFAALLARRELVSPLEKLTSEAERVAAGDLTPPLPLAGRDDELGRLSRALNRMARTARGMVEEARHNQERFQRLFTGSRDAAFIIDRYNRLEEINPAGVKMFGYPDAAAMLRLPDTAALFANELDRRLYLNSLASQGYVQDFPLTMRRLDGSTFQALITATVRQEDGGRFGLVRNVTLMREAQRALRESEERHRRLLDNAPDIIYRWSIPGRRFDYLSRAVKAVTGYTPEELMADNDLLLAALPEAWKDKVLNTWRQQIAGNGPNYYEHSFQLRTRTGELRWLMERSLVVRDEAGQPVAFEGIATDITDRQRVEEALQKAHRMVETTLAGLPVAVMVIDDQHKVVHWNQAMEKLSGTSAAEMVGTSRQWEPFYHEPRPVMADMVLTGDMQTMFQHYGEKGLRRSPLIEEGWECEDYFPGVGGENRFLYFIAAPIRDADDQITGALETLVDLTEKRKLEEELRRLSVTDDLTGLFNQRFFYASLRREIAVADRYQQPLTLLMLDLDYFKAYNDCFGHLEGDLALARSADAVRRAVRAMDLPCRYGGEEFAVLLPRTSLAEGLRVAERIRSQVEAQMQGQAGLEEPAGAGARLTVSLGAAVHHQGDSGEELVRQADRALYRAKSAGRNAVGVEQPGGELAIFSRGASVAPPAEAGPNQPQD
ncbi:MAG: diguanylate cyclase [Deltaproteobacteria bacterium]|nr:diguanylate cyclase [Deltaproteobacteria bacterium]